MTVMSLSQRKDKNNQPLIWGIGVAGVHVSLDNEYVTDELLQDEINDVSLSVYHMRALNEKWSMLADVGAGLYSGQLNDAKFNQVLGNVGVLFIRHLKPNLDLGVGAALNNSFGYPMLFPAFYLEWMKEGKYTVQVSVMNGIDISLEYELKKYLSLNYIVGVDGQVALVEKEGVDRLFTHQYIVTGFQPEIKLGEKVSIPITAGISTLRPAQYYDRSLKGFFTSQEYYFRIAPYFSVGLMYNF